MQTVVSQYFSLLSKKRPLEQQDNDDVVVVKRARVQSQIDRLLEAGFEELLPLNIYMKRDFFSPQEYAEYWNHLKTTIAPHYKHEQIPGMATARRLNCAMSDGGAKGYAYSGKVQSSIEWTPEMLRLRDQMRVLTGIPYNFALINYYPDGSGIGAHSDSPKGIVANEFGGIDVLSLTFSTWSRDFQLERRTNPVNGAPNAADVHCLEAPNKFSLELHSNSVLLMTGRLQEHFKHSIGTTAAKRSQGQIRINITFRYFV